LGLLALRFGVVGDSVLEFTGADVLTMLQQPPVHAQTPRNLP